jgi:hypothetical protein
MLLKFTTDLPFEGKKNLTKLGMRKTFITPARQPSSIDTRSHNSPRMSLPDFSANIAVRAMFV